MSFESCFGEFAGSESAPAAMGGKPPLIKRYRIWPLLSHNPCSGPDRGLGMRRRDFIMLLGSAAVWPLTGHAQQPERIPRVGVLISPPEGSPMAQASVTAFVEAMRRFGWVEGKNIRIDYRFAAGDPTLFKTYATELVDLSPDAILTGGSPAVAALQHQTHTIPIVFTGLGDPVGQ